MKFLPGLLILFASCNTSDRFSNGCELTIRNTSFQGKVVYQKLIENTGFRISLKTLSGNTVDNIIFHHTLYQLDTVDIDHDGNTEILIGLIKPTTFDPVVKKRLFILRVDGTQLRPRWLGSKVCQELIDFKSADNGMIQTLERTTKGNYAIGSYHWQSFGLILKQYRYNEIPLHEATKLFNH